MPKVLGLTCHPFTCSIPLFGGFGLELLGHEVCLGGSSIQIIKQLELNGRFVVQRVQQQQQ